jgi:hypothetical protein
LLYLARKLIEKSVHKNLTPPPKVYKKKVLRMA